LEFVEVASMHSGKPYPAPPQHAVAGPSSLGQSYFQSRVERKTVQDFARIQQYWRCDIYNVYI
jgi:hypothetical protein